MSLVDSPAPAPDLRLSGEDPTPNRDPLVALGRVLHETLVSWVFENISFLKSVAGPIRRA